MHPDPLSLVGSDGVDGLLALDEGLEAVGVGVDGGDLFVEGADCVGAVGGLDFDGGE